MAAASLVAFLLAFVVAFAVLLLMERLAPRLGLIDRPRVRKGHDKPTPLGGGVAIWLGTLIPVAAGVVLCHLIARGWAPRWTLAFARAQQALVLARSRELLVLLVGGTAIVGLGLADDR
jgi:UDP-GlcNAc:undecaprenyl-phosphate GlcNAc-1-phosphate transferase